MSYRPIRLPARTSALLAGLATLLVVGCSERPSAPRAASAPTPRTMQANAAVLRVPDEYPSIQAAVNAAAEGATIQVRAGIYAERVVVSTSGLRLQASKGAVIDGGVSTGIGIHVLGFADHPVLDVEVSGFEVTGFERGIVVQWARGARIHGNDVHHILDRTPPLVLGDGIGIDLVTAQDAEVSENRVHHNGDTGIALRVGSTGNVVRGNWIYGNGTQQGLTLEGRGILLTGAGTNDNQVLENEVLDQNGRGVLVARPAGTAPISGNRIAQNRLHGNQRAGIALMGPVTHNIVEQNDARDNNLSGLPPCYRCNLFDQSIGGNIWKNNLGTLNLTDPVCAS